jgi:hypothetical protein
MLIESLCRAISTLYRFFAAACSLIAYQRIFLSLESHSGGVCSSIRVDHCDTTYLNSLDLLGELMIVFSICCETCRVSSSEMFRVARFGLNAVKSVSVSARAFSRTAALSDINFELSDDLRVSELFRLDESLNFVSHIDL